MAITYDELVTLVTDTIQPDDESTFASHVVDFIQQAEDMIIRAGVIQPMRALASSIVTVAGDENIALPAGYISMVALVVNDRQLKYRDSSFLSAAFPDLTQGQPRFFSDDHEAGVYQVRLRPIPNAVYTGSMRYLATPASLTAGAGSGTTWISTNMEAALVYGTLMHAALYIMDKPLAETYERKFKEAVGLTKIEQEGKALDDRRRKDYARPKWQEE